MPIFNQSHKIPAATFTLPEFVTSSRQKSSYQFLLDIQPILESHDQSGHTHFWQCWPKNFQTNFKFSWICNNMQKIWLFLYFVLEISWFKGPLSGPINFLATESHLISPSKLFSFLRKLLIRLLRKLIDSLIRKLRLISNFRTS